MLNKYLDKYNKLPIMVKATLWFLICNILQKAISLITTPIFTRIMTTTEYGKFSVYTSWVQIFTIITTLRLDYATFNKGMSKYSKNRDEYVSAMQALTTIITTIVLIFYLLFRKTINNFTELSTPITLFMFIELYLSPAISFWTIRQRYEYKYKIVVFVTILMSLMNPFIGIVAVKFSHEKGVARILSCIFVQVCFGLILYIYNIYKGKKIVNIEYWKFALLFNIPLIPHYFSTYILEQSDRIMIQKLCGIDKVAIYSVAYNVGMVMKIVTNSVNNAILPWQYNKLENKEFDNLREDTKIIYIFVLLVSISFIAFAPELVKVLASKEYYEAVNVIPPVAASVFFVFMYGIFANVEFYYDANKFTMYLSFIGAALNLILNALLIPILGYVVAGYTTLICYVVFTYSHYFYMKNILKKHTSNNIMNFKFMNILSITLILTSIILNILYKKVVIRYLLILIFILLLIIFKNKFLEAIKKIRLKN